MIVCLLDQSLDQQGVKNHSKMMVLKVSDNPGEQQVSRDNEKKNHNKSVQRTHKGFQILSERGDTVRVMVTTSVLNHENSPVNSVVDICSLS